MRIGILSQWFDPEPGPASLPGVLARGLVDRGHDVQVVTGFPNYPTGLLDSRYRMSRRLDERIGVVDVRRVALYPSHDGSVAGRLANYASFGASAVASGIGAFRGMDAIWVYASPITVSWPLWATRLTMGIPTVAHALDLWPDTLAVSGFDHGGLGTRPTRALLSGWSRLMYRSSTTVAYISPGVGDVLAARGVPAGRLAYVPLWADEQIYRPGGPDLRARLGIPADAVVLLYAGPRGTAQGLESLVDAAAAVRDAKFVCLIAGSGSAAGALVDRVRRSDGGHIRFLGRLPQIRMTELMATADICYIGLRRHPLSEITMPSKTQAALAAGRAVLAAARGDVARVVRESRAGWAVDPDDAAAIADRIRYASTLGRSGLAALGRNGRDYYDRNFSIRHGVQRIEDLLADASARSSRPGRRRARRPQTSPIVGR